MSSTATIASASRLEPIEGLSYKRFLFLDSFVVSKSEYIEHILLTNHANYRKSHFTRHMLGPVMGQGLITSEGELWRRQRHIAAPAFHARRITEMVSTMAGSTEQMLPRWRSIAQPFDLVAEMTALALDIIARTMFSADVGGEVATIQRHMDVVANLRPSRLDRFGFPEWIPRYQPRRYRAAIAAFEALVAPILAERQRANGESGDLLSMLLSARDAETGERMSDRQLRDEILTIFTAGHETTGNALAWTFYLLARHPDAEARLHEEIECVLGGRRPTSADLAELKWTRMVLQESMRLYPPAYTVTRTALGEDRLGGMRVPPGAFININIYETHRNPTIWRAPEQFRPRAVCAGRGRRPPSLCLSAVRRRPPHLHRRRLCDGGGAGDPGDDCAALPAQACSRLSGRAGLVDYTATQARDLGDARAALTCNTLGLPPESGRQAGGSGEENHRAVTFDGAGPLSA
jgi:cytochrome P450